MSVRSWGSIVLLSIVASVCCAQSSIKGTVTGLPGATVLLLRTYDSTLVKGTVADNEGKFLFEKVEPGTYDISVSMIGYSTHRQKATVDGNISLPDIVLVEATETLDEIVVRGDKPLFEQMPDRLVVNVQSSVVSSGNSVLEVLQKSPGVTISPQSSTISINGKNGVRVMINGKASQLPADVVVQMLDGMSASNVDRIEIIATPSSRYDAEGNAGVIHIITKENLEHGTNGIVGLTAGYKWAETLGANFGVSRRTEKFALYSDYSFLRTHNLHKMDLERHTNAGMSVVNHSHRENWTDQHNLNIGAEWQVSKNFSVDVLLTGYSRRWRLNAVTDDVSENSPDSTVTTRMNINERNFWQGGTASVGLQATPGANSELSVYLDYLYYRNDNPSFYNNLTDRVRTSMIDLDKTTPIGTMVVKTDYRLKVSPSFTIESGIKGVKSALTNDVLVRTSQNDEWMIDPVFTSYSNLEEVIGAGYVATTWTVPDWQLNAGIRYEYTHTSIGTPQQEGLVDRRYGYFFPNLIVKRNLTGDKDLQVSYSKRITRP
ncbi:MAG TPA: outer membrane beta-barrel protein, partial [Cyclobacteriaceae bacterium]|nr:outer membrane beta-barrel protein [Cyclobacteriaceae bacterium]